MDDDFEGLVGRLWHFRKSFYGRDCGYDQWTIKAHYKTDDWADAREAHLSELRGIYQQLAIIADSAGFDTTPFDRGVLNPGRQLFATVVAEQSLRTRLIAGKTHGAGTECHVTLSQMAAIVSRGKRTLERLARTQLFPNPDVPGGGGKPSEWRWSVVRPFLESEYDRELPDQFPADRFVG